MSSQPHSACFKGLPPLIKDRISRLNHAAEASVVDRYQPYGVSSLAALVHFIFAVRRYFICPAALPYRQRWLNFLYLEGSTKCTGLGCEHLYQRFLSRRIKYSFVFIMTFRLQG
jgi:hypothetical protein